MPRATRTVDTTKAVTITGTQGLTINAPQATGSTVAFSGARNKGGKSNFLGGERTSLSKGGGSMNILGRTGRRITSSEMDDSSCGSIIKLCVCCAAICACCYCCCKDDEKEAENNVIIVQKQQAQNYPINYSQPVTYGQPMMQPIQQPMMQPIQQPMIQPMIQPIQQPMTGYYNNYNMQQNMDFGLTNNQGIIQNTQNIY